VQIIAHVVFKVHHEILVVVGWINQKS